MDEDAFLRKLLDNPADDLVRLVYADWLDERETDVAKRKAEFLRATCELAAADTKKGRRATLRKRLSALAADLEPDWLAVVSRLKIENCAAKRTAALNRASSGKGLTLLNFDFVCDRRWDELRPTDDPAVRQCDACREAVHYCDTIGVARTHAAAGHCIAVDLGIKRHDEDLSGMTYAVLGRPSAESLRRMDERNRPDPVSEARENRKREATDPT